MLSAQVEVELAAELLTSGQRTGYLLKDRISDADGSLSTWRIVNGAAVVDPAFVQELLAASRIGDPLDALQHQLWVTEGTVEKHIRSVFTKLRIPEASADHRRVPKVLTFLDSH